MFFLLGDCPTPVFPQQKEIWVALGSYSIFLWTFLNYKHNTQNLLSEMEKEHDRKRQKQTDHAQGHRRILQHSCKKLPEPRCPDLGSHLPGLALLREQPEPTQSCLQGARHPPLVPLLSPGCRIARLANHLLNTEFFTVWRVTSVAVL